MKVQSLLSGASGSSPPGTHTSVLILCNMGGAHYRFPLFGLLHCNSCKLNVFLVVSNQWADTDRRQLLHKQQRNVIKQKGQG